MSKRFKRLAVVSDCVHVVNENGTVATENHIYCRQMQALALHFEQTIIVCPFVQKKASSVVTTYTLPSINFLQLPNAGGRAFRDKLKLLRMIPLWWKAFAKAYRSSDLFYLRMPNNLNIPGFFYFYFKKAAAFATYTGTWKNYNGEPSTYRFQKWLLKKYFKGPVWIYSNRELHDQHLFRSISPSFSAMEWSAELPYIAERIEQYRKEKPERPVLITVGALVTNKNQQFILNICKNLKEKKISFYWYIVGDGDMREIYEHFIYEHDLADCVCMAGKKTYEELQVLYRKANFIVQASLIEGFGKAPIEAMCHGVIPLLSKTAMAEEMTGNGVRGFTFDTSNEKSVEDLIIEIAGDKDKLIRLVSNGRLYVKDHTLEKWAMDIVEKVDDFNYIN